MYQSLQNTIGRNNIITNRSLKIFFIVILVNFSHVKTATGLSFTPTATEWAVWTEYCRARYVVSAAGKSSEFKSRLRHDQIKKWEYIMGPAWYGLHHYCASRLILHRGIREKSASKKRNLLENVINSTQYTLDRTPSDHFMIPEMIITQAQAHSHLNKNNISIKLLSGAIKNHPKSASLYTALAIILRDNNNLDKALEVLNSAHSEVSRASAELHYIHGLLLFEKKDYEESRLQATKAYTLGYPLQGLKNKLKKAGYWSGNPPINNGVQK